MEGVRERGVKRGYRGLKREVGVYKVVGSVEGRVCGSERGVFFGVVRERVVEV